MNAQFGWLLLVLGLLITAIGLWFLVGPSVPWLGRLPGDIRIEGEHYRFYFPVVTCILLSIVLSLVFGLVAYFLR